MATMLYASGVAATKREAALAAGLAPQTFYMSSTMSEPTQRLHNEIQELIADESVRTSAILEKLGRRAIGTIAQLMETGKDEIKLKAAQDLADRTPDTQRTQQVVVPTFSLAATDVAALAAALVESSRERERYRYVTEGLVEVNIDEKPMPQLPTRIEDNG